MFDESDEVNLHSQFIFSLLNFKTGNEYRYLNAFLKCVDSSFEYNLNSLEIHKELHDIDILRWTSQRSELSFHVGEAHGAVVLVVLQVFAAIQDALQA